ncbi:RNA 2',3'-cyclic phosphodiesterase [Serratia ficaria]|uniref:RNA 2',3'-cyclic phosphodiesterase n=1 Tax=Serratia ficaria TaxID=61651 RepID=A0A240CAE8_SERFI|nr:MULTISPECIES: RNA 2',3'-cyclic phosphodiesterase [Serratia]MEE4485551.1 RNA 2',3'-cyclic phosphodiesterase [Serratia ficaria]REF43174.1 2'-5' RNA ligase [Serratia ficaria]CAI0790200.1 2'-5'-RNA ligase [Serratia ficaria]CAI0883254.1 2'-5'-RNA ligase [Serratia ficaria]CAI1049113.1 2'-5'-RNA ligase [Serratia ficaria]
MSSSRRLFFALPLPDALQQQVIRWRADAFTPEAGRPVAAANLHLTLAFLGDVTPQKALALTRLAGRIVQPGFSLRLDDLGHWPRPGVVWLGTRRAPRGLLQLAELLRSQAARSGCYQSPMPFHPHITLLRAATQPVAIPPATPGWTFSVEAFSLYQSVFENGRTRYHPLEQWPLAQQETR